MSLLCYTIYNCYPCARSKVLPMCSVRTVVHPFNWKKKFGGMGVTELRRLRQLEEENHRLKRLVADLSLDKEMPQDVIRKKF